MMLYLEHVINTIAELKNIGIVITKMLRVVSHDIMLIFISYNSETQPILFSGEVKWVSTLFSKNRKSLFQ
ncbi:hypothetical protein QQP08_016540, partial [Theobroma cacao]